MSNVEKSESNSFDQLLSIFWESKRVEIIATLLFTVLILSIGLSVLVFGGSNTDVVVQSDQNQSEPEESVILVDIQGAITNPGVYELTGDSRVKDVVDIAGGLLDTADITFITTHLNMVEKFTDGQKIYIPSMEQSAQSVNDDVTETVNEQSVTLEVVSLNSATLEQLESLPGIGPVYAKRIIEGRPYATTSEITSVKGIGQSTYESLKDYISL